MHFHRRDAEHAEDLFYFFVFRWPAVAKAMARQAEDAESIHLKVHEIKRIPICFKATR